MAPSRPEDSPYRRAVETLIQPLHGRKMLPVHDGVLQHHIIAQPFAHVLPVPLGKGAEVFEESVVLAVGRGHEQPDFRQHGQVREPGFDRPDGDGGRHPAVAVDDARDAALAVAHSGYGLGDFGRVHRQAKVVGLVGR